MPRSGPPLYQVTVSFGLGRSGSSVSEMTFHDVTGAAWVDGIFVIKTLGGETITYPERVVMRTRTLQEPS